MMDQDHDRVLSRKGARIITPEEAEAATGSGLGGPHTNTACTFAVKAIAAGSNSADGDLGECGS